MPLDSKSMECSSGNDLSETWVLPAALRQLQECGETALVEELIAIFQTDTASRLEVLSQAVKSADFPVARQEAHTMKGSALQVGAVRFAEACRQMELEARNPGTADLGLLYQKMVKHFDEVRGVFAAQSGGSPCLGSPHNGE